MSTRITDVLRRRIKNAAGDLLHTPRRNAVEAKIGAEICAYFSETQKKAGVLAEAIRQCESAGYLTPVDSAYVDFGQYRVCVDLPGKIYVDSRYRQRSQLQLATAAFRHFSGLRDRLQPLMTEYAKVEKEWSELSAEISAMLQSASTTKRLIEIWPNVLEIYPDLAKANPATTALVVNPEKLDKRIAEFKGAAAK